MKRTPIARKTPLERRSSPLRTQTPIKKVNPIRKAKRQKQYRAHLASAEYKHARKEAMQRAKDQCEWREPTKHADEVFHTPRCTEVEALEAHHLRYPKTRPLEARDLLILCKHHHAMIEMRDHAYRHT